VAGQASGGQKLTPNPNVTAVAGRGGDKWGANGGDINPVGVGQPVGATLSYGETAANYQLGQSQTVLGNESTGVLNRQTLDSALPAGGRNAG